MTKLLYYEVMMIFASLLFIYIFLPLNLFTYFVLKDKNYRNISLVIFSLIFYAWEEPRWIVLLVFSATVDFIFAQRIEESENKTKAKQFLVMSICINLGLLVAFKYSGFLAETVNYLLNTSIPVPKLKMPIGISFYTFQTMSYVIDVYRSEVKAQKSYSKFLMYVSLFPQLVAGPIVRYKTIAEEIDNRKITVKDFSNGITRFLIGLAKKVIISNEIGEIANTLLNGDLSSLSVFGSWVGILMFALQIYFDFSGYSDMAIGLGKIFGFHYLENFNYPYISKSVSEFWRRWHISLGVFFRDYLYIPLGGNKKRVYLNIFIVWFLTGLWHGSSWNFVIWGLYFCVFICIEKIVSSKIHIKIHSSVKHIYTMVVVIIGWAVFYFTDFNRMVYFIKSLFGFNNIPLFDMVSLTVASNKIFIIVIAVVTCAPVSKYIYNQYNSALKSQYRYKIVFAASMIISLFLLCLSSVLLVGETYNPFLYYRF